MQKYIIKPVEKQLFLVQKGPRIPRGTCLDTGRGPNCKGNAIECVPGPGSVFVRSVFHPPPTEVENTSLVLIFLIVKNQLISLISLIFIF